MRPDLVVVPTPVLDHDLRIDTITKPLHRQALVAELAVEGFVGAVLPRLARVDQRRLDLLVSEPAQNRARQGIPIGKDVSVYGFRGTAMGALRSAASGRAGPALVF